MDTTLKGFHLRAFVRDPIRIACYIVLCVAAMSIANRWFQLALAYASLICQIS